MIPVRFPFPAVLLVAVIALFSLDLSAQLVINEGSNKNYNTLTDEDGDQPDWIELFNAGPTPVELTGYTLTDEADNPGQWPLPSVSIPEGGYMVVYCSGKNRFATPPFTPVENSGVFTPATGWNTHVFDTPFYWDGTSHILINICSYRSAGYITNSVFKQTETPFASSRFYFEDGSPAACTANQGYTSHIRPNIQLNGQQIGFGQYQNSTTDYPAPYGNWYYGARHQLLFRASELQAAGLTEGNIVSLAFEVVFTDPVTYDYIDFSIIHTTTNELDPVFWPANGYSYHTNFKLDGDGEAVFLFDTGGQQVSSLDIHADSYHTSKGSSPDASAATALFSPPTPGASNNSAIPYQEYALAPVFTTSAGLYNAPFQTAIIDLNPSGSVIRYTLDGSEPQENDQVYTGGQIPISQTRVLRARAFVPGKLPSSVKTASYLFDSDHTTPVLSVVTDHNHLYGPDGIFDNPAKDWLRPANVEYFADTEWNPLVFSQTAAIRMDGGAGGSRWNPQRSFRASMAHSVLGEDPIEHLVIPHKPQRLIYSDFYLRNGSNQYLILPYKDAAQVRILGNGTKTYYSDWRPISVYVNGSYFGLYELREKLNREFFELADNASPETVEILSLSYFYGSILRAVEGSVDNYWMSHDAFSNLNPAAGNYLEAADALVDLDFYTDYIIGQIWMGNTDWPQNNIRIYRSDQTDYRWRFCTIDQELALLPNAWTDCHFNALGRLLDIGYGNPFTDMWYKSLQNASFKIHFINRFADLMNTAFAPDQLIAIESEMYEQTAVEMANEYARWGDPGNIAGQMSDFFNNHLLFQSELLCRSDEVRNHLQYHFDLPQQVDLTLDIYPPGAGQIRVSTVTPDNYPWQGIYFDGIPVEIEAIPAEGYAFQYWEPNELIEDTQQSVFDDTLHTNAVFTAHFEIVTDVDDLPGGGGSFGLYPSPADDVIHIVRQIPVSGTDMEYQILDTRGQILHTGFLPPSDVQTRIDIRSLPAGIYYIRIQSHDGLSTRLPFIKAD